MAFLAKPDVLMIDELSLDSPLVVEQLLAVVRQFREQGVTVILVEQSVNVAPTTADKAFFMKGAVRFHGLTAELLERPDLLFHLPRRRRRPRRRSRGAAKDAAHNDQPRRAGARERRRPPRGPRGQGITRRFSGSPRSTTCRSSSTRVRSSASSGPTAQEDHAVRPHLGVPAPDSGSVLVGASTWRVGGRSVG
jgi:ABC-type glutathione transport system ATPase component